MSNNQSPYVPSGQPPRELSGPAKEAEDQEQKSRQETPQLYLGERSQDAANMNYLRVFKFPNGKIISTKNEGVAAALAKKAELVDEVPL